MGHDAASLVPEFSVEEHFAGEADSSHVFKLENVGHSLVRPGHHFVGQLGVEYFIDV